MYNFASWRVKSIFLGLLILLLLPASSSAFENQPDPVIEWNTVLLNLIRENNTTPPAASRKMAIVHISIYEAVNSIEGTHEPYNIPVYSPHDASTEAAATAAAYHSLKHFYPNHASLLEELRNDSLSRIPDSQAKNAGILVGEEAAFRIIQLREGDGHDGYKPYLPQNIAGKWVPTLPHYADPLYPHWGLISSFSRIPLREFWPEGPPALTSQEYAREFHRVKQIGAKDSSVRTADQTEIAHFWEDGPGTFTPPGHWNVIAQKVAMDHNNTLAENARLFALLNIAVADAGILCWEVKYAFDFWRPVTAIRHADVDGNPLTSADTEWEPLLTTPPFPEYTSGHSTFSGAASAVLASFFGDNVSFETYSIADPNIIRSFSSFSQAAEEAMNSRLYGGIHFDSGNHHGYISGKALGEAIARDMLLPRNQFKEVSMPTPIPSPVPSDAPFILGFEDKSEPVADKHITTAPHSAPEKPSPVPVTAPTGAGWMVWMLALLGFGGTVIYQSRAGF